MTDNIKELTAFLSKAHSPFHVTRMVAGMLEQEGFVRLQEKDPWGLLPGGKYYIVRGGSSLLAFRIPTQTPSGFMMAASHDDFPAFQVKGSMERTGRYTRIDLEPYGGSLLFSWLDRPLSVAGRVMVAAEEGVEERLIDIDRDLALIPNVAIHMNREVNDGYRWNPAVDLYPLVGGADSAGKFRKLIEQEAGGEIMGLDLRLYIRQNPTVWGLDEEYFSGAGLDDLTCVWASTKGFLHSEESQAIPMLCIFDHEEVGSVTCQGADSTYLESVLMRICRSRGLDVNRMLSQSFMISADNGHAVHPNHPEFADRENAPVVNSGVLLKFHANRKYTTDGLSASVFRTVCRMAGVESQNFCNRPDLTGGSTLGNVSIGHVSVPSVDIGLPQLAMHSCYETAGVKDIEDLYAIFKTYYSKALLTPEEGQYHLR